MSGTINNFNSTVGIQTIGTQVSTHDREAFQALLMEAIVTVAGDSSLGERERKMALETLRALHADAGKKGVSPGIVERALTILGSIASLAGFVEQIRPRF